MKVIASVVTAAVIAGGALTLVAQGQRQHILQNFADARWTPAPPLLPAGAQISVLSGDPMSSGPYTVRLKFPGSYAIPAHSHPTDENVVVISGALTFGMGDRLVKDVPANKTLSPGG